MKSLIIILILLILKAHICFSQSATEIDSLLSELCAIQNSKNISKQPSADRIINYGDKVLPILTMSFLDMTKTEIKSDCQNFLLTKGEVAIILADRIEIMPYSTLTGIQNCILVFCKDNPNLIEYYLSEIRRDGALSFKNKYVDWLKSKERKKWSPYLYNKKKEQKYK